jgi:hypothetical protein
MSWANTPRPLSNTDAAAATVEKAEIALMTLEHARPTREGQGQSTRTM